MHTLAEQLTALFNLIGDIVEIHHLNPDLSEEPNESVKLLEEQLFSNNEEDNIKIKEMTPLLNKILYKLYSDKGIKRKLVGNLIQLFYDKTHPSYDKDDAVTQLCRHLVIDPRNLRIVSMGVTKACDYDTFKEQTAFSTVTFEEFPDGTMCVYTPELSSFQNETKSTEVAKTENHSIVEDDNDDGSPQADVHTSYEVKVNGETKVRHVKDFKCSTRKVLGTGFFNSPSKSFHDMFKENNERAGLNLDNLPEEYKVNHSYVFNVQHNENRIITPIEKGKGVNTLCAVFKFKSGTQATAEWDDVIDTIQKNPESFREKLKILSTDMVTQLNLDDFVVNMSENGLPFKTVKNITAEIMKNYSDYESFEAYINSNAYDFQGIVLKTESGIRTKIRNKEYDIIKELKGSLPIMTEERNNENLFRNYWRLRQKQDKSLTKFCQYFGKNVYSNLFNHYNQKVYGVTRDLHSTYMAAFVNKSMVKSDIPFAFKPMCGDLHKLYQESGKPVTLGVVINYINNSPVNKIYWRIYGLPEDKKLNTNVEPADKDDTTGKESTTEKKELPTEEQ